ncbi:MAG: DUF1592 domain-containing protein, partial [Pirellulaceae bacterium]|nr:DUF1592 domain-containing protein [Pirellulaceae bacterium]
MLTRTLIRAGLIVLTVGCVNTQCAVAQVQPVLSVLQQKCLKCHGGDEVNGEVDFKQVNTAEKFRGQPKMIDRMINAIADNSMPPEDEPPLDEKTRVELLAALKTMLREATAGKANSSVRIRRLNRFQYNNTVKDLFQLKQDLFGLPEKLMTRYDNYLHRGMNKMPDVVQVASHSLKPQAGLRDVNPFPKDARANHGFDNQANQLTLSPLLLDAFLRLSVSLVESPDFNDKTVGVWKDLFQAPAEGTDQAVEAKRRLETFLKRAFRGPVDEETVGRYVAYTEKNLGNGLPFTESMKKVVSAILSSPRFLYRTVGADASERQFELASNLSYVLWGSCPDDELLQLAENGELSGQEVLQKTVLRMMADPRIERFLDTFPSQWMQLENLLAATPDPQLNRYFSL